MMFCVVTIIYFVQYKFNSRPHFPTQSAHLFHIIKIIIIYELFFRIIRIFRITILLFDWKIIHALNAFLKIQTRSAQACLQFLHVMRLIMEKKLLCFFSSWSERIVLNYYGMLQQRCCLSVDSSAMKVSSFTFIPLVSCSSRGMTMAGKFSPMSPITSSQTRDH